ncbi:MAG TPA: hypothetical protein DIS76_03400, partial [Rhodospirillaceae bacterium]|nr:hypothetical protein [Rhodospirillaceae bacterium]
MAKKLNNLVRALGVIVMVLFAAYTVWWAANPAIMEEGWEGGAVKAFSFAPFQKDQNPLEQRHPTREQIQQDLKFLSAYGYGVRTYSVQYGQEAVPELAKEFKLKVALGAWVDKDEANSKREIDALIKLMRDRDYRNTITMGFVGNEAILRGDKTVDEMIDIIKDVRRKVRQPVSTAAVWQTWLAHPELVEAVDFIAVHVLPYWEGVSINHAVDHVFCRYEELQA